MENPEVRQNRRLRLGWGRNGVGGGAGMGLEVGQVSAAPKHTKETGDSTSTRSDSTPENIQCLIAAGLIRKQKQSLKEDMGGRRRELTYTLNKF